ncbi:MAG: heavy metal-associated domain-containing protein [Candidatus Hydrothermales bacterium]
MEKVEINIEGMVCHGCAKTIYKVLEKLGAKDITLDFENKKAVFLIDNRELLLKIKVEVEALGYRVSF